MATIVTRAGKGSALTWTEGDANITNLNNDKIELTDLSVGAEGTASGDGAIAYDNTTGVFTYTPPAIPAAGIAHVVEDTTPQLGGSLDVNGQSIVSVSNGNINIEPNGTGDVYLTADTIRVGDLNATAFITTNGTGSLQLHTNSGTNSGTITIAQGANGIITISPNGTGRITLVNPTLGRYIETAYAGGSQASAYTPNWQNGTIHNVTLTGNVTFAAPTNMIAGSSLTLILTQDATGGRTGTWNASYTWLGGTPTLSTTANAIDVVNIYYDGTNWIAGISKEDPVAAGGSSGTNIAMFHSGQEYITLGSTGTTESWTLMTTGGITGMSVSTNTFILPAGTYMMELPYTFSSGTTGYDFFLRNVTDSVNTGTITSGDVTQSGVVNKVYWNAQIHFTIAATKTFRLQTTTNSFQAKMGNTVGGKYTVKIVKYA